MEEISKPVPRVFRAQISKAYSPKVQSSFVIAIFGSLYFGRILYHAFSHSILLLALPATLTIISFIVWRVKFGKTQARIEVSGNDIYLYDDLGNRTVEGNLREIAVVYRSSWAYPNSLTAGSAPDSFHVLFQNGALMSFGELYDNHFMLLKILHVRTGVDPIRIGWSDFERIELDSQESRIHRVSELMPKTKGDFPITS